MAHQSLLTGRLRAALLAAAVCVLSLAFAWSAVRASDATEPYMVRQATRWQRSQPSTASPSRDCWP